MLGYGIEGMDSLKGRFMSVQCRGRSRMRGAREDGYIVYWGNLAIWVIPA